MGEIHVAGRIRAVLPSASIAIAEQTRRLQKQGISIVDLSWGEPDFPTPPHVIEAAQRALGEGKTKYTPSGGIPELRQAIAQHLEAHGLPSYSWDKEILVTPGGKQAILYAMLTFLDPGDEVIVPEPCWLSYGDCAALAGGRCVTVPSTQEEGFKPSLAAIERALTDRTRLLVINNPCNPSGALWSPQELEALAQLCVRRNLLVVSDDIYDRIVFDSQPVRSISTFPGMRERTLNVNSLSKTYAMTGLRLGWVAAPQELMQHLSKVHQHSATCATSTSQWAAIAALQGPQDALRKMVGEYQQRRDYLCTALSSSPVVGCFRPSGAFYVLMDVRRTGLSSQRAAEFLLEHARVSTIPGNAYGNSAEGYVRLSFAVPMSGLKEAVGRIDEALAEHGRNRHAER